MPWRLIYTSAPRGLLSGQSGFCTVARSADLRAALVQRLEQISSYHYLRVSEAAIANRNPTISAFRLLDLRGAKYYVLTRIQPCGLDFTARTNHLAQHLIFQPDELSALPTPAAILRHWPGWMTSWQGEPRVLEDPGAGAFAAAAKSFLPAQTWEQWTGDAGRAAGLLEGECLRGCYLICPTGSEEQLLTMYCETLELLNPEGKFPLRPWRYGFTTFLQAEDNPNDFQWRGCQEDTPAYKQAVARPAPLIPLRSVRVPANDLVKRAREGPRPPPSSAPTLPVSSSSSTPLSLRPHPAGCGTLASRFPDYKAEKPAPAPRPAFLGLSYSNRSATLARLGIFALLLLAFLLIKFRVFKPPAGQGKAGLEASSETPPAAAAPPSFPPAVAEAEPKQLSELQGDGPTYVLAVPNLTNFTLPIDTISRLQNLLQRYDKLEPGTLPNDLRLEVNTDRWDSPPGAPLKVAGRKEPMFSASGSGLRCVFDYSDSLWPNKAPVKVQAEFDRVPGAFSIHFGFASSAGGDPFRLLFVSENNPPAPLPLGRNFVRYDRQDVGAALADGMRECLFTNFQLLAGWKWQLQPLVKPHGWPAQPLYRDWPPQDKPLFGCELDFGNIRKRLEAQRQDFTKRLEELTKTLGLPLGKWLEFTNANLVDFRAFSPADLSAGAFLAYLEKLQQSALEKSWIKKWHDHFNSDQPEEVPGKLQELYSLWSDNRAQDASALTVPHFSGATNYFFDSWERLKEAQPVRNKLARVENRLVDLDHVAYVGLYMVNPRQPGMALEMVRFNGP